MLQCRGYSAGKFNIGGGRAGLGPRVGCSPGRCPTGGWCSAGAAPSSAGCSSSERQIAGTAPRARPDAGGLALHNTSTGHQGSLGQRTDSIKEGLHSPLFKRTVKAWRDGSVVRGIYCSCREPGFNVQHPDGSSQPFVTPVKGLKEKQGTEPSSF